MAQIDKERIDDLRTRVYAFKSKAQSMENVNLAIDLMALFDDWHWDTVAQYPRPGQENKLRGVDKTPLDKTSDTGGGENGTEGFVNKGGRPKGDQPWVELGISRQTWYNRQKKENET